MRWAYQYLRLHKTDWRCLQRLDYGAQRNHDFVDYAEPSIPGVREVRNMQIYRCARTIRWTLPNEKTFRRPLSVLYSTRDASDAYDKYIQACFQGARSTWSAGSCFSCIRGSWEVKEKLMLRQYKLSQLHCHRHQWIGTKCASKTECYCVWPRSVAAEQMDHLSTRLKSLLSLGWALRH